MSHKYVYLFSEGNANMRELLGGKGANLAEMTNIGLPVPQGVTIENAGGAVPVIADGETDAAATTLVWFSETAPGIFTAKSETVKAVV